MYFKKSEDIARNAYVIGCGIEDIKKLDEYLAQRNRRYFSLFDVKSNTDIGNCAEPILNQYVKAGVLSKPQERYLCPIHDTDLEIVNINEGKCIDCNATHLLDDCETEMVYERRSKPNTWLNGEAVTTSNLAGKEHTPWWKRDTFKITCFAATLPAILSIVVPVFLPFNPVSPPIPDSRNLPVTIYVTPSPNPTSTEKATSINFQTPSSKHNLTAEKAQEAHILNRRLSTKY